MWQNEKFLNFVKKFLIFIFIKFVSTFKNKEKITHLKFFGLNRFESEIINDQFA